MFYWVINTPLSDYGKVNKDTKATWLTSLYCLCFYFDQIQYVVLLHLYLSLKMFHSGIFLGVRDEPFSTYEEFFEVLTFLNPWYAQARHQKVRNDRFLRKFAYVRNGWSISEYSKLYRTSTYWYTFFIRI